MVFEIRKKLQSLVVYTYPKHPKLEQYKKFYYELNTKIMKSKAGCYDVNKKKIRIFAVGSVNPTMLFIVSIHELSHHIDYINRHTSDHSREFYAVYKQLLFTALDRQMVTIDDIYKFSEGPTADRNKVLNMLGDYKINPASCQQNNTVKQQKNNESNFIIINVFDCYNVKERIKMAGYKWNPLYKCWSKTVNNNDKSAELAYIQQYVPGKSIQLGEPQWKE